MYLTITLDVALHGRMVNVPNHNIRCVQEELQDFALQEEW